MQINAAIDILTVCLCPVRTDFQLREDQGLAHRLQEQECKSRI